MAVPEERQIKINMIHTLRVHYVHGVSQGFPTCGPRAACGPRGKLDAGATTGEVIFNKSALGIYCNCLKISKKCLILTPVDVSCHSQRRSGNCPFWPMFTSRTDHGGLVAFLINCVTNLLCNCLKISKKYFNLTPKIDQ